MLGNRDAAANIAVRNLGPARKFYEGTLGLKPVGAEGDHLIAYRSGNATLLIYQSGYAGTNKATTVTWSVGDDVEGIVRALKA
ncbi:MAG TPA: VOC family protein, partial [Burkholderiales bacterium]|nr:VOC family protein [Burkholderiales bacterium]